MKQLSKYLSGFIVNNLLILSGIATIVSGFALQLGFHMDSANRHLQTGVHLQTTNIEQVRKINPTNTVWGIDYASWSAIHKVAIVLFSLLMIYHFVVHWKWYKGVFARNLINKNKQVIILSVLFIMVASTGFIPWFIDLSGNTNFLRLFFIEIHDKLAIILTIYLILHVTRRIKWFSNTFTKFKKIKT